MKAIRISLNDQKSLVPLSAIVYLMDFENTLVLNNNTRFKLTPEDAEKVRKALEG